MSFGNKLGRALGVLFGKNFELAAGEELTLKVAAAFDHADGAQLALFYDFDPNF